MEAKKHTATPWRATGPTGPNMQSYSQPYGVAVDGKAVLICGCFGDIEGGEEVAKANSEFIVRAVNAHDHLVKALQDVIATRKKAKKDRCDNVFLAEVEQTAKAAIAKAGA